MLPVLETIAIFNEKRNQGNPIIRDNLMNQSGYSPYCGDPNCRAGMTRTKFNGEQFTCRCGWVSVFPAEFIAQYKQKWGK